MCSDLRVIWGATREGGRERERESERQREKERERERERDRGERGDGKSLDLVCQGCLSLFLELGRFASGSLTSNSDSHEHLTICFIGLNICTQISFSGIGELPRCAVKSETEKEIERKRESKREREREIG
jgi:hypothetical protein